MYGTICGTVGKDAELKALPSGTTILEFSVVENAWTGKETSTWYRCNLFGKRAEALQNKLLKGTKVSVIGQSYEDVWVNNLNDEVKSLKCKVTDVVIQKYADGDQPRESSAPPAERQAPPASGPTHSTPAGRERFEDDIPF